MEYELVIPSDMTLEFMVDHLAHAVWRHLVAGDGSEDLLPAHFMAIREAIGDRLAERLDSDRQLGWVRCLTFRPDPADPGAPLERQLADAVAHTLGSVLSDEHAIRSLLPGLPVAIKAVFEPYLRTDVERDLTEAWEAEGGAPEPPPDRLDDDFAGGYPGSA